jgi:hypothetical protein
MDQYAWWDIYGSLLLMSVVPVFLLLATGGVAYWRLVCATRLMLPDGGKRIKSAL